MKITHCDICKNPASESQISIALRTPEIFYRGFDICIKCGKEIIGLLHNNKLLDNSQKINANKNKRTKKILNSDK